MQFRDSPAGAAAGAAIRSLASEPAAAPKAVGGANGGPGAAGSAIARAAAASCRRVPASGDPVAGGDEHYTGQDWPSTAADGRITRADNPAAGMVPCTQMHRHAHTHSHTHTYMHK